MMYISTFVWVLHTPNAGGNSHFQHILCKKAEKMQKKLPQNLAKKLFFKVCTKALVDFFIPNFIRFSLTFTEF